MVWSLINCLSTNWLTCFCVWLQGILQLKYLCRDKSRLKRIAFMLWSTKSRGCLTLSRYEFWAVWPHMSNCMKYVRHLDKCILHGTTNIKQNEFVFKIKGSKFLQCTLKCAYILELTRKARWLVVSNWASIQDPVQMGLNTSKKSKLLWLEMEISFVDNRLQYIHEEGPSICCVCENLIFL